MPRIWLDYCQFLMDQCKVTRTRRTFDRALQALPLTQHHRIWPLYIKFVHLHNIPETTVRIYRRYLKVCVCGYNMSQFQKGTFSHKIIFIKCLSSITHHSAILYSKSMKYGIQEVLLLSFLDTEFHLLSVQSGRMTTVNVWSNYFVRKRSFFEITGHTP